MRAAYWALVVLAALAILACITAAARLDQSWLVPGGAIKIDKAIYAPGAPKFVALTFDDGPGGYTAQVARVLEESHIKATFFLIGNRVSANRAEVQALLAAGHEIGDHSYSHPVMSKLSAARQRQQLEQANEALKKAGATPQWFRPPYGAFNHGLVNAAAALDMQTVLWSVDPRDWAQPGVERIQSRVLRGVGNGAVVLLHCTHAQTVAALPGIIHVLRERGYAFVTLSAWRAAVVSGQLPGKQELGLDERSRDFAMGAGPAPPSKGVSGVSPEGWLGLGGEAAAPLGAEQMQPAFYAPFAGAAAVGDAGDSGTVAEPAAQDDVAGDSVLTGAGAATLVLDEDEGAPAGSAAAVAPGGLRVFTNFGDVHGLQTVLDSSRGGALRAVPGGAAGQPPAAPGAQTDAGGAHVSNTTIMPGGIVPALPPGEELVIPPSAPEELPPAAPATPSGEMIAPAAPALPGAPGAQIQGPPLSIRIIDLVDMKSEATAWTPPARIDPADLAGGRSTPATNGALEPPRFYFLSLAPKVDDYIWVELQTIIRLGKLSGLVLSDEFVKCDPQCALPYPWERYCYYGMDRAAMVDLTVENAADVIDIIAEGKRAVFVVVRPCNLNFFIEAHTLAEMERNLRDFILLRQMTAGLPYDPGNPLAKLWDLPRGVSLACFTDGARIALVLYTHDYLRHAVQVPQAFAQFSRAVIDPGGWLKVARLDESTVTVDATPVILYYELQRT